MIILLDNGSKRPEATKNLRRLAAAMTRRDGEAVHPVSLLHSSSIPPEQLDGRPAETLEPFLQRQIELGVRNFVVVPLFFGRSRAIDVFLPEIAARIEAIAGPFDFRVAPALCPLPSGEPRLVDILEANVRTTMQAEHRTPNRILLVDHGSPVPAVTAVRQWLAHRLAQRFIGLAPVTQAVMERRAGREYDFNGELLGDVLAAAARNGELIILAMQFISPGRHAGAGGDIEGIAREVMESHPGARAVMSPLIGEHPLLAEILSDRINATRG
ncbi:MAG: CbiX/SirB N-terminal domain-containing protein [Thiohalocapsa sp.]